MKRRFAVIMAALLIAAMAGCSQSGTSSTVESAESEISEAESSVVSEVTSTESSEEKSDTSAAESSESKSKTESSQSKTEESSKKETSKAETSKTETSKAESSKTETSKTETSKTESSKAEEPKVTGINLDMSSLTLTAGNSYELNAYIQWSNGNSSYNGITWSTSNNGVASVSSSGYVTAKSAGTATITASYGSYSKSCTVTVKAAQVSQPSQPSGGGSSGNGGSTQTPSTPSTTVDTKYYPKGDYFKSQGCQVVTTSSGRTTYDITNLILPTINKYRQQEGVSKLSACTYEYEYNCCLKVGQNIKNNKPRRAERIKAGEDSQFNPDFTPRVDYFSQAIFAEQTLNLANCIELASAGGHGDGHAAQILSTSGKFDMDATIGNMKGFTSHWNSLMDPDATNVQVILYISNENSTTGTQGYHLAISVGPDFYS